MCRLLAYLGEPTTAAPLVFGGDHSLHRQSWQPKELLSGSVNADGYGIVWYHDGRPGRIAEARPIWYDDELRGTLEAVESPCVFAALRNSTPGIPVDRSGLLPMVHDRWSFALNGFVPDFRKTHMRGLREELPDDLYAELRGSSDSETLFLLTVAHLREEGTMVEALRATVEEVTRRVGKVEAQLNMVLADGETLAAVRTGTRLESNSLYVAERPPFAPGGVVLASEAPEAGAAWTPVDGHSWIEIDADGTVRSEVL